MDQTRSPLSAKYLLNIVKCKILRRKEFWQCCLNNHQIPFFRCGDRHGKKDLESSKGLSVDKPLICGACNCLIDTFCCLSWVSVDMQSRSFFFPLHGIVSKYQFSVWVYLSPLKGKHPAFCSLQCHFPMTVFWHFLSHFQLGLQKSSCQRYF